MARILKSQQKLSSSQTLIHLAFTQCIPSVHFGNNKIPRCEFCSAYLSCPLYQKEIQLDKQISTQRFLCTVCGSLSKLPNNLPLQLKDLPDCYRVELLPTHAEYRQVSNRVPITVILFDQNYPLIECMKNALIGILEKLDQQYDFLVCSYDSMLTVYDLRQGITAISVSQGSVQIVQTVVAQNNQQFRTNLSDLLQIKAHDSTFHQKDVCVKSKKQLGCAYNGSKSLAMLHQALKSIIDKNKISNLSGFRVIWLDYLSSVFWQFKKHPKIMVQAITFTKNQTILQQIANHSDKLIVISDQNCIEHLHFTLYEMLGSQLHYFSCFQIRARDKYSVQLLNKQQKMVASRNLGVIFRDRNRFTSNTDKKNSLQCSSNLSCNIYQVSLLFYDPQDHKKYLQVCTFSLQDCQPHKTMTHFQQMWVYLQQNPNKLFTSASFTPNQTCYTNKYYQQLLTLRKDPVCVAEICNALNFGDINGTYILFPIIIQSVSLRLVYCYRSAYKVKKQGKYHPTELLNQEEETAIAHSIEKLNEQSGIYYCRYSQSVKLPICYQIIFEQSPQILLSIHHNASDAQQQLRQRNPQLNFLEQDRISKKIETKFLE